MWTGAFWRATAERAIRGGAAAVLSLSVVGDGIMNAFEVNWQEAGGVFIGGAVVSTLLSLVGGAVSGNGPAFNDTEQVIGS